MRGEQKNSLQTIMAQTGTVLVVSFVVTLLSVHAGFSVLLGGLCCTLPNIYFAFQVFRRLRSSQPGHTVARFYRAEVIKLVMMGVLCALTFKYIAIQPLSFFAGFFLAQISLWIVPLRRLA
jgi:ATP synthase protein I